VKQVDDSAQLEGMYPVIVAVVCEQLVQGIYN
jgi:hypothetical protein